MGRVNTTKKTDERLIWLRNVLSRKKLSIDDVAGVCIQMVFESMTREYLCSISDDIPAEYLDKRKGPPKGAPSANNRRDRTPEALSTITGVTEIE